MTTSWTWSRYGAGRVQRARAFVHRLGLKDGLSNDRALMDAAYSIVEVKGVEMSVYSVTNAGTAERTVSWNPRRA